MFRSETYKRTLFAACAGSFSCLVGGRGDLTRCGSADGEKKYDVIIIGGGVVGLATARCLAAARKDLRIAVVEKEDSVAAGASSGNSGLGCTGYDSPAGSLERRLLRRSIRLHPELYRSFGLSVDVGGHVRKSGSIVVAWTPDEVEQLPGILEENRLAGDCEAQLLGPEELLEVAPELSRKALGAVMCPHEAVVEPWLVPVGFAISARALGVEILTGRKVVSLHHLFTRPLAYGGCDTAPDGAGGWKVVTQKTRGPEASSTGRSEAGSLLVPGPQRESRGAEGDSSEVLSARVIVNCAEIPPPEISPPFTVTPRKGQFVVFRPKADCLSSSAEVDWRAPSLVIEPVPSQRTKGIIVWQTVYGNVVAGPTATDQHCREDRSTDPATLRQLEEHARRVVPGLRHWEVIGSYSGLRPSTEHRDYQIHASREERWVCVGGIRSTGLTAASGIAEHVTSLLQSDLGGTSNCPMKYESSDPVSIMGVSDSAASALPMDQSTTNNKNAKPHKFSSLADMSKVYVSSVAAGHGLENSASRPGWLDMDGFSYRVTHPISSFGMENYKYISDLQEAAGRAEAQ